MRVLLIAVLLITGCSSAPKLQAPPTEPAAPAGLVVRDETISIEKLKDPAEAKRYLAAQGIKNRLIAMQAKAEAKTDFANTVKRWTGWMLGILAAASILLLIVSFFVSWISTKAALMTFAATAGVSLLRYALLRYGTMAADIAVYVSIVLVIIAAGIIGVPLGVSWVKRRLGKTADKLGSEDPRAATALWAASVGATTESVVDKFSRKQKLAELSGASDEKAKVEA